MRLEGQAKAGEYPAPVSAVLAIASMLRVLSPDHTTIADPFGSDGRALNTLARTLGVPSSGRYLAELKPANVAAALQGGVGHAVACDRIEIVAGLAAGEDVVIAGQERLADGIAVEVEETPS